MSRLKTRCFACACGELRVSTEKAPLSVPVDVRRCQALVVLCAFSTLELTFHAGTRGSKDTFKYILKSTSGPKIRMLCDVPMETCFTPT